MSERIMVVTSSPPEWRELRVITNRLMQKYCNQYGYDFHSDVSNGKVPSSIAPLDRSSWIASALVGAHGKVFTTLPMIPLRGFVKLDLLLRFLPRYDAVVWLDADLIITNPTIPITDLLTEETSFLLPYDLNGVNATVIGCRKENLVFEFLTSCNTVGRQKWLHHNWGEQMAFAETCLMPPYRELVTFMSAKSLCAMPKNTYALPGASTERYEWERGDFAIHLSAMTIGERVKAATQIARDLSL